MTWVSGGGQVAGSLGSTACPLDTALRPPVWRPPAVVPPLPACPRGGRGSPIRRPNPPLRFAPCRAARLVFPAKQGGEKPSALTARRVMGGRRPARRDETRSVNCDQNVPENVPASG